MKNGDIRKKIADLRGWRSEPLGGVIAHYDALGKMHAATPNWPVRIDDAEKLYDEMKSTGLIRLSNGDGDSCDLDYLPYSTIGKPYIHVTETTNARAISIAYLKWMGAIDEHTGS